SLSHKGHRGRAGLVIFHEPHSIRRTFHQRGVRGPGSPTRALSSSAGEPTLARATRFGIMRRLMTPRYRDAPPHIAKTPSQGDGILGSSPGSQLSSHVPDHASVRSCNGSTVGAPGAGHLSWN